MTTPHEDEAPYQELRPLMFSIAYRMTGSVSDAEDIVQEAFLGLTRGLSDGTVVESPKAYLAAATTHHAINHLRSARVRREAYVGAWLPEPLVAGTGRAPAPHPAGGPDPAEHAELADSLSMAFLVMLESLSPLERAVFLLREAFGYDYGEVARIVGKSEQNCRQILARARQHIGDRRPRFESSRAQGEELARRFFAAAAGGEMSSLLELLSPDVVFVGDGGGKALALRKPLRGQLRVARFIAGLFRRGHQIGAQVRPAWVNGQPGGVSFDAAGRVINVFALDIADGTVQAIRSVVNPDKLSHLGPVSDMGLRTGEDLACSVRSQRSTYAAT
jgi:RNA polymerase sigma-70 factor (TIGR02957 family)